MGAAIDGGERVPCVEDPGGGWTATDAEDRTRASLLCETCPVLAQCFAYVEAHPESENVWGGLTPPEREYKANRDCGERISHVFLKNAATKGSPQ